MEEKIMKLADRFIGKEQWTAFFLVSFFISFVVSVPVFLVLDLGLVYGLLAGIVIFIFISIYGLLQGYLFFYNNYPDCKDMEMRRFYSIPEKHACLVEVNGVYPEKPLYAGYYFIFPFFKIVTFSQTIFLGDFNGIIFDENDENKIDFDNGVSTPIEAMYVAHLYSGPELGTDFTTTGKTEKEAKEIEDIVSILASMLDKEKDEIRAMKTVTRELKSTILENSIKRYAKEENADNNIREMLMSLLRLTLGSQDSNKARKDKIGLDKLKEEDPCVFNSIIKHYGVDIRSVNISDIKLSPEEIEINRAKYQASLNIEIAKDKRETAVIEAEGKAKVMELEGQGLEKQIASIVRSGASAQQVLEYLTKMKQWESMKATDKSFIIDNGGSIAGILAAIKSISNS